MARVAGLANLDSAGDESLIARRRALFRDCMPLLQRHGYRGVSLKALAQAAGLSVAGLYHYFPSKRDLALYPLSTEFCLSSPIARHMPPDPLGQLCAWIDGALDELPETRLALDLAAQIADGRATAQREAFFVAHARWLGAAARSAGLSEDGADELARAMLALAAGENATGIAVPGPVLRRQLVRVLRAYLAPAVVEADPFATTLGRDAGALVSDEREEAVLVRSTTV